MAIRHRIKTKHGRFIETLTRARAIRFKCLDCCGWQERNVRECPVQDCALWPFRMGKKPETIYQGGESDITGLHADFAIVDDMIIEGDNNKNSA